MSAHTDDTEVVCRIYYDLLSSGWLLEHLPNPRSRGTDLMMLIGLALHARPLRGEDLELLISLGVATAEDRGRLYVRVTDLGLSREMGVKRDTVAASTARLAGYGLVDVRDLPPGFRDSRGQFSGTKAYFLSGALARILSPDVLPARPTGGVEDGGESGDAGAESTAGIQLTGVGRGGGCGAQPTGADRQARRAPPTGTNMPACSPGENEDVGDPPPNPPPVRRPGALTVRALTNGYPIQPDGIDPDRAFNLALDKALALLPARLRGRAGVPLYTLAAELHPAAQARPSRAWPDAGGAGWVLDAVIDAIATGPVGSVNLIHAITDRWLAEGNPYAIGARMGARTRTDARGRPAAEGGGREAPAPRAVPEPDPLLGEVTRRYEAEIGGVTEGVAERLRALIDEHPNPDAWRRAFGAVVRSNVRRLDYLEACLKNDGARSRRRPRRRRRGATPAPATRARPGRGQVVSPDDMPPVEPETPLPPP